MAYYTDVVNNFTGIKSFVTNTLNNLGWNNPSGDIWTNGTIFAELIALESPNTMSGFGARYGIDASLSEPAWQYCGIAPLSTNSMWKVNWPANLHLFVFSNEVYAIIIDATDRTYHCGFGKSSSPVLTGDDGHWCFGSTYVNSSTSTRYTGVNPSSIRGADQFTSSTGRNQTTMPFWGSARIYPIGADIDGSQIRVDGQNIDSGPGSTAEGHSAIYPAKANPSAATKFYDFNLYRVLPNSWNAETVLLPYQLHLVSSGLSQFSQFVHQFDNMRKCRIDYLDNGEIISFGGEQWMVFSSWIKNAHEREGVPSSSGGGVHSGTHGFAIRYG